MTEAAGRLLISMLPNEANKAGQAVRDDPIKNALFAGIIFYQRITLSLHSIL